MLSLSKLSYMDCLNKNLRYKLSCAMTILPEFTA